MRYIRTSQSYRNRNLVDLYHLWKNLISDTPKFSTGHLCNRARKHLGEASSQENGRDALYFIWPIISVINTKTPERGSTAGFCHFTQISRLVEERCEDQEAHQTTGINVDFLCNMF